MLFFVVKCETSYVLLVEGELVCQMREDLPLVAQVDIKFDGFNRVTNDGFSGMKVVEYWNTDGALLN